MVRFERDHQGSVRSSAIDCPIDDFHFAALDFVRQER
jgi:hypothetical protein